MTQLEKLALPVSVTLQSGDWDVVLGQVTGELSIVRDQFDRAPYFKTLERIRETIFKAQARTER